MTFRVTYFFTIVEHRFGTEKINNKKKMLVILCSNNNLRIKICNWFVLKKTSSPLNLFTLFEVEFSLINVLQWFRGNESFLLTTTEINQRRHFRFLLIGYLHYNHRFRTFLFSSFVCALINFPTPKKCRLKVHLLQHHSSRRLRNKWGLRINKNV